MVGRDRSMDEAEGTQNGEQSRGLNPLEVGLDELLAHPRETLGVEIKEWLNLQEAADRSTLAKAAIALANYGGGILLIGLRQEPDGVFSPAPNEPDTLVGLSPDLICEVIASYAEPPFQPTVFHRNAADSRVVAVLIPGGHRTPIQAKRGSPDQKSLIVGRVYIRRPGPKSAEPASSADWRELIDRCIRASRDDLLDAIRNVLGGASPAPPTPDQRQRLVTFLEDGVQRWWNDIPTTPTGAKLAPQGYYAIACRIDPSPNPPPNFARLQDLLGASNTRHTGWPPWWVPTRDGIRPYVKDGALQCSLAEGDRDYLEDPAHSDFWRVTPSGEALLIRGFDEDGIPQRVEPGKAFDLTLPVWRIGEALIQAATFGTKLGGPDAQLTFMARWSGLERRELCALNGNRHVRGGRISRQNDLEQSLQVAASDVPDQLPELLYALLAPLYALFDLFDLPKSLVDEELRALRKNRV